MNKKKYNPIRTLRISDENWAELKKNKPRDLTWNGYITKINKKFNKLQTK